MAISVVSQPAAFDFVRNPLAFTIQSSNSSTTKFYVTLHTETYYNSNTYIASPQLQYDAIAVSGVKTATIFVGELIRSYFNEYDVPSLAINTPTIINKLAKKYYLVITSNIPENKTTDTLVAINGKINYMQWPTYNFQTQMALQKAYLNYTNKKVNVYKNGIYFLHLYNTHTSAEANLKLNIKVTTTEGFFYYDEKEVPLTNNGFYVIPTGPKQLNISNQAAYYEVWVTTAGGSVTLATTIRFNLINPTPYAKEYFFINNFGVFEQITGTGTESQTFDYKGNEYTRFLPSNYNPLQGQFLKKPEEAQIKVKASCTNLTHTQKENIRQLLNTPFIYVYCYKTNTLTPAIIENGTIALVDQSDSLSKLEFTYSLSYNE